MRLTILTFATILSHGLFGQDESRFKNFHGINHPQSNVDFFEAEGYDIFIQSVDYRLDEKGISKIKKKYSAEDGQLISDPLIAKDNRVLLRSEHKNGVVVYFTYYLIPDSESKTIVIGFVRPKTRDVMLERDFVNAYISNRIPSFIYTKLEIDSIDFVGRTIGLGSACHWMSPHNIQCPDLGQMNWAIFDSSAKAEEYRDTHYEI